MACEKNISKISATAGVKAGIGMLQNKFNSTSGRMVSSLSGGLGRSATATLRVLESFDGPRSLDALGALPLLVEAGTLLGSLRAKRYKDVPDWWFARSREKRRERQELGQMADIATASLNRQPLGDRAADRARRRAIMTLGLLKLGQAATVFAGTGLGRLSRREQVGLVEGVEQRFFFLNTSRLPVGVWQSRLTPWLNRADAGPARPVRQDGIMFEVGGKTWHRGTVVVKTAQGQRTLTHLQGLSFPAAHYYYNRRLADNEAVGIVSGQKGFEPKYLKGYAGQVSEVEALFPAWAGLKHSLIRAHLLWGEIGPKQSEHPARPEPESGATPAKPLPPGSEFHPLDGIGARVTLGTREYPVLVRRVVTTPGRRHLAEAAYYDEQAGVWKEVTDQAARRRLAEQVAAGLIETMQTAEVSREL